MPYGGDPEVKVSARFWVDLLNEVVNAFSSFMGFMIWARFGSWLTPFGPGFFTLPYAGNLDFQISARSRSWLTPFDPGVSASALTFFEAVNALCW